MIDSHDLLVGADAFLERGAQVVEGVEFVQYQLFRPFEVGIRCVDVRLELACEEYRVRMRPTLVALTIP